MNFFKPEEKTINELFIASSKSTYSIPSYQRLYSWEAKGKNDRDSQVNIMWEDLIEHFKIENDQYYFMGSMVHIAKGNNAFEVVDGQQRLTTLSLLFVAIKCFLKALDDHSIDSNEKDSIKEFISEAVSEIEKLLFNKKRIGVVVKEKKVKIERTGGFDYDSALRASMECAQKNTIITTSSEERKTVDRFFENRDFFINELKNTFLDNGILSYEKYIELNEFIDFLRERVLIIRIICQDLDVAYQVFEILNNRGLPLSNKDLFRNFIIKELTREKIDNAEKKWLILDEDYEFSSEFLSRYVESTNGQKQRKSAFNDVTKNIYNAEKFKPKTNKKRVELFYEDIKNNLEHYSNIELVSYDNIQIKHRVEFLKNSGNSRYINNLLLSLFRNISEELKLIDFLKEMELFVLYQLLGPSKRFQSSVLFSAINYLNDGKYAEALSIITTSNVEKTDLKDLIISSNIQDNSLAKLIIARYFWAQEIDEVKDVVNLSLSYKDATLEHIIPQKPKDATNWKKDFSATFKNNYTYKLGNMTLLTHSSNSRAKNYDFKRKEREVYIKTKLPMTVELCGIGKITEKHIKDRHIKITNYLINHFEL